MVDDPVDEFERHSHERYTGEQLAAMNVRLAALQREFEQFRVDVKEDLSLLAGTLGNRVSDVVKGVTDTETAKWNAHTGQGGDHDQLAIQRGEDISRVHMTITTVVTLVAAVLGSAVGYLYVKADGLYTYFGAAFLIVVLVLLLSIVGRMRLSIALGKTTSKVYRAYRRVFRRRAATWPSTA